MENDRKTGANRRLAKKRVPCLNEVLYYVSSVVPVDSLVLRNPLLRQAPKRYRLFYDDNANINQQYLKQTHGRRL